MPTVKLRNSKRALNSLHCITKNTYIISNEKDDAFNMSINTIELNLTDIFDLKRGYCSYKIDSNIKRNTLQYSNLDGIVEFKPKAIVLAGGRESTLYKNNNHDIYTFINKLHANNQICGICSVLLYLFLN